jgi:hypothetical protein
MSTTARAFAKFQNYRWPTTPQLAREKLANPLILCDHRMLLGRRVPLDQKGIEMRLFAVIAALCMLSQSASAQMSECKSITDSDTRLACYDRIAAAAASPAPAKPAPRAAVPPPALRAAAPPPALRAAAPPPALRAAAPPPAAKIDGAGYVDSIGAEDAKMNAQLKNICRGC